MTAAGLVLRAARPEDAAGCAAILNDWIDATDWMPRVHPPQDVVRHYRETVLPQQQVTVADDGGVSGFIAVDPPGFVTALYVAAAAQRRGLGRLLLGQAKAGATRLTLWTFQANFSARAFYAAAGFAETRRTDGDNEEGLADILLEWSAR